MRRFKILVEHESGRISADLLFDYGGVQDAAMLRAAKSLATAAGAIAQSEARKLAKPKPKGKRSVKAVTTGLPQRRCNRCGKITPTHAANMFNTPRPSDCCSCRGVTLSS